MPRRVFAFAVLLLIAGLSLAEIPHQAAQAQSRLDPGDTALVIEHVQKVQDVYLEQLGIVQALNDAYYLGLRVLQGEKSAEEADPQVAHHLAHARHELRLMEGRLREGALPDVMLSDPYSPALLIDLNRSLAENVHQFDHWASLVETAYVFARAGDADAYKQTVGRLMRLSAGMIEADTMLARTNLRLIDPGLPDHGLTRAMIANGEAMNTLMEIAVEQLEGNEPTDVRHRLAEALVHIEDVDRRLEDSERALSAQLARVPVSEQGGAAVDVANLLTELAATYLRSHEVERAISQALDQSLRELLLAADPTLSASDRTAAHQRCQEHFDTLSPLLVQRSNERFHTLDVMQQLLALLSR